MGVKSIYGTKFYQNAFINLGDEMYEWISCKKIKNKNGTWKVRINFS
jgi:hypothetical protein